MRAGLLLALVACSSTARRAPLAGTADTAFPPRTTPAPTIEWGGNRFDWHYMPAIARDRSIAVVPHVDHDAGRGYPNFRLEVRSREDRVVEAHDVLLANDYERLVVNDNTTPELDTRIDRVNSRLDELHREHDLSPMPEAARTGDPMDETPPTFFTQRLRVRYDGGKLHVKLANRSFEIDGTPWKAPRGKRCPACDPCENPELIRDVWVAEEVDAMIVVIGYRGTDTCWEPADQWHVVTW